MITDENLKDITSSYIQQLEIKHRDLTIAIWFLIFLVVALASLFIASLIGRNRINQENKVLKEQLIKDEEQLSLEYSIGYWFINNPKEINDTVLYQFLLDNNAWYPDILLKQAKIESANYTSNVYKNTNNLYGMRKVGKRQTTQLNNTYNGYGCYSNWCLSVLDRMLWDIFVFKGEKPSEEEYLKAIGIYAEDKNYINKLK